MESRVKFPMKTRLLINRLIPLGKWDRKVAVEIRVSSAPARIGTGGFTALGSRLPILEPALNNLHYVSYNTSLPRVC